VSEQFDEPGATRDGDAGLVRIRIDLAYDGTDFSGWAKQPGQRTIQGELESALAVVLRLDPPPQLTVAGRTDAGVHARGQVAHLDVPIGTPLVPGFGEIDQAAAGLVRRLNGVLPVDVRVREIGAAAPGFDARFAATSRRYSYRVADGWLDPVRRRDTLAHPWPLEIEPMVLASARLLGEHDFAAYCKRREGATTVRELLSLTWARGDDGVVIARVEADAFCHSMVRALVGAILAVGDGRRHVDWPASVLAKGVRDPGVGVVPAHGLTLDEVRYPDVEGLAERAKLTRQLRSR
jgi:tRNA pseudouridine38-40 synthase